ncbi:MAG: DUF2330 domain-containing protein [Kouleothrix sp.]|jgi:hypothetical protein|nr:DUF2330 domain-containing protein [Kouleothrix sp.]
MHDRTCAGVRASARLLLAGLALLGLGAPAAALACGMPLAARMPSEQALIIFAGGREQIITSVHLQADGPGAAVIFPVPGLPEVSVLARTDLFEYLAEATKPDLRTVEVAQAPGAAPPDGQAGGGVVVLGREQIGGYDLARLSADDPGALQAWLDLNGYRAPPGAGPIVQAYIAEGWKFVAVKLAAGQPADGALAPLRMAFDAQAIVYPMRLGALSDQPVDVLLYIAAEHRVSIPALTLEYASPIAQLSPAPPAEHAELLRAPFLTKLRGSLAPASLTADFVAERAPDDRPYRLVLTRRVYVAGRAPAGSGVGLVLGLALAIMASAAALGVAVGLRRRIDRLAGPDPDEDEDA